MTQPDRSGTSGGFSGEGAEPASEVLRAIRERRSSREGFSNHPVPPEFVATIVEAGLLAPSSKNAQPWRFHVVTQRGTLNTIADLVEHAKDAEYFTPIDLATGVAHAAWSSTVAESAQVLREVPVAIFIENTSPFSGGRLAVATAKEPIRKNAVLGFALEVLGHGAAINSMWLTAQDLGLGAVFMGDVLVVEEPIRNLLSLQGDLIGVLVIGVVHDSPTRARQPDPSKVIWHH